MWRLRAATATTICGEEETPNPPQGIPEVSTPVEIELRRAEPVPTLQELVAQITADNRYGEISTGRERGRDTVEW
jgi:hypothetical protein